MAEGALRAECAALEASFSDATREVERLTRRRCSLERALSSSRDELGQLRAAHMALQRECESWQHREELARQRAAEAIAAAEALADSCAAEAREARHELRTCREELTQERSSRRGLEGARSSRRGPEGLEGPGTGGGGAKTGAGEAIRGQTPAMDEDVEAAVLALCLRLEQEASSLLQPLQPFAEAKEAPQV
ncbi:unnamed protein product [Polarella glacialis]|nr:unnamed protein product [Polarella glacialis]